MQLPFDLVAQTEPGKQLQELMRTHASEFAERAADIDREGRFVAENFASMQQSGAASAAVPKELGGLGVESVVDLIIGTFGLAQGCGSSAISSWMHIGATFQFASVWRAFVSRGRQDQVAGLEDILRGVVAGRELVCIAGTEPGVTLGHFKTTARPVDDGWEINGLKTFATLSPGATLLNTALRVVVDGEPDRVGFAQIRPHWDGVTVTDDWDGMGMRGSGSGRVIFENCRVAKDVVNPGRPIGEEAALALYNNMVGNYGLVPAGLGVAQAARDTAIEEVKRRRKAPSNRLVAERVAIQMAVGEIDMRLNAAKSMMKQTFLAVDHILETIVPKDAELQHMREVQAALREMKLFCETTAVNVVNRSLQLTSGSGYVATTPMARYYRDVRALPFMAPQEIDTLQYNGMVRLGLEPEIDM